MLEVTIRKNDISVTKRIDSDSVDDCKELAASSMSFLYGYKIDLLLHEEVEDDDIILCEGVEPIEEREMDGL